MSSLLQTPFRCLLFLQATILVPIFSLGLNPEYKQLIPSSDGDPTLIWRSINDNANAACVDSPDFRDEANRPCSYWAGKNCKLASFVDASTGTAYPYSSFGKEQLLCTP